MIRPLKILLICILAAFVVFYLIRPLLPQLEWDPPEVKFVSDTGYIGLKPFEITVSDIGTGLKNIKVYVGDEHAQSLIVNKDYDHNVKTESVFVKMNKKMRIEEGKIKLKIIAEDHSRIRFFRGNKTELETTLTLDMQRPRVKELSSAQYIKHGGAGFIIYSSSKDTKESGIRVGDRFFPGYSGYFNDPTLYLCFFTYPYNADYDEEIYLYAVDAAGNDTSASIFYELSKANYKESTLFISDKFILRNMLPFVEEHVDDPESRTREIFLEVNNKMRRESNQKIEEITKRSVNHRLWSGRFKQLSNSKVVATFGDKRNYTVKGESIDQQYHLGYDLSVTKKYPVEAANGGLVVFVGEIGLYGNSVIVDHGLGIMSLYSHLSSIVVNEGDGVKEGSIIGRTGTTGFALGDHLHFGMYVHGIPVSPLEWWDPKWINEKIESRIKLIQLRENKANN